MATADEIHCERLEGMEEEITGYALGLAKTLQFIWNHVGQRVETMRGWRLFYVKKDAEAIPAGREKTVFKLTHKLQHHWPRPFVITKMISPILYDAYVHGITKRVHAVNMKPVQGVSRSSDK